MDDDNEDLTEIRLISYAVVVIALTAAYLLKEGLI